MVDGKTMFMREKAAAWKKKRHEIAAVLLCLAVLGWFVSQKEGFHMDELLSFELSNAEFNPWIVTTQPEGRLAKFVHNEIDGDTLGETLSNLIAVGRDVLQNRGNSKLLTYQADVYPEPVWITAQQFADYIQVDGSDAFNYLSVYFNVKDDNHPPLHFMLLHTVSSIFQGKAEAWMGCVINLAAIGVVLILLMKLGRLLAPALGIVDSEEEAWIAGLCCALFYGLSAGAVATALLIRMYGLLTLWCVAYFYLVLKKWEEKEFDRDNFCLIAVTILGFWTQYFFLFYCILLAAVAGVLLFRQKRMRELWRFVRSMTIAAAVGVGLFPFAVSDVLSSGRGVEALGNLSAGFSGYGTRLFAFLKIVGQNILHPFFWMLVLVLAGAAFYFAKTGEGSGEKKQTQGRKELLWIAVLPPLGYFFLAARMSPYLVDRYVMPVYPFAGLGEGLILAGLLCFIKKRMTKRQLAWLVNCVYGLVLTIQVVSLGRYNGDYLYSGYALQEQIAESNSEYPCICIYDGFGYYENLPEFTHYEKSLLLTYDQLVNRQDRESIRELDKVALLIKYGVSGQPAEILEEYGFTVESVGWRGSGAHGDLLIFMRKDE